MRNKDDNFGLIEILAGILRNRTTMISFVLSGIVIALIFTFTMKPLQSVKYTVKTGNTLISDDVLMTTSYMSQILQKSKLNKNTVPYLFYTRDTFFYEDYKIDKAMIKQKITESLVDTLKGIEKIKIKDTANYRSDSAISLLQIEIDEDYIKYVKQNVSINFSKIKNVYPRPLRHGLIGALLGFLLGMVYLGFSYLFNEAKKIP